MLKSLSEDRGIALLFAWFNSLCLAGMIGLIILGSIYLSAWILLALIVLSPIILLSITTLYDQIGAVIYNDILWND
jgi:hypothetical protein